MPEKTPIAPVLTPTVSSAPRRRRRTLAHDRPLADPASPGGSWTPKMDVIERGRRLIVTVDLPGVREGDVMVTVTAGRLTISGQRRPGRASRRDRFWRSERDYGTFHRVIPLPDGVEIERVSATFDGGVLEVGMPLPSPETVHVTRVPIGRASKPYRAA